MNTTAQRPKVLVIAEAANPEWVSVPLIGWSLTAALREVADVHLVTQVRNRPAILRAGLTEGVDFTAINTEALARPITQFVNRLRGTGGKGWTMATAANSLIYPYFEHLVWKQFGADIRAKRYDIVHRVTPLSPTTNSPIARRCAQAGVPFMMGPLNGGVPWPAGFDQERRREREWLSYVRGVYKLLPGRTATLTSARAILTGSRHTQSEIPDRFQSKCIYLPENAFDPTRFTQQAYQPGTLPLRACFIGRLVPYKGADMLLEAARPLLQDGRLTLDIIGDGPMREALDSQTKALNISDAVTFHGWIDHTKVQEIAAKCHLLTFPSIREFGGGVVLEAMALSLVPIVIDYAGPGELVADGIGFKVPIGTRAKIVADLRQRLEDIAANPAQLAPLARAAQTHAQTHFTWSAKAAQVAQVYNWLLSGGDKPMLLPTSIDPAPRHILR